MAWAQLPPRARGPAPTLSRFAGSLQPGREETRFPFCNQPEKALNAGEVELEREEHGVGTGVTACYKPIGEKCSPRTSNVPVFPVGSP